MVMETRQKRRELKTTGLEKKNKNEACVEEREMYKTLERERMDKLYCKVIKQAVTETKGKHRDTQMKESVQYRNY